MGKAEEQNQQRRNGILEKPDPALLRNQTEEKRERSRTMPKKSSKQSKPKAKKVPFDLFSPEAQKVSLAAGFNGWDVTSLPMKGDAKGNWKINVDLQPGKYEYRFWVDGRWQDDPNAQERVNNPFGTQNCVRIVA
jgi:1,4-alpha-glucan branching enzyme